MELRRWSAFLLLPALVLLERFAYYGMRATLFQDLLAAGDLGTEAVRLRVQYITWITLATPLLGGLVAIALKPRWTLVAGAVIAAAGYALLAALGSGSFGAFVVLAIGLGLFRPAVWATAALAVQDPEESARGALFVAIYAATNVAGFVAPLLASSIPPDGEVRPFAILVGASAVLLVLATLLAAAVALAPRIGEEREPPDPPFTGRGEIGAVVIMALMIPSAMAMMLADDLQFSAFASSEWAQWIFYVNPLAVLAVTVIVAGGLGAMAYAGRRIPALYIVGGGMVVAAIGSAPLLALAGPPEAAQAGAFASVALIAIAEALIYPLALGRMTGGTHSRSAALVVAAWLLISAGISQILVLVSRELNEQVGSDTASIVSGSMLAVAAVASIATAAGAIALQRFRAEKLWSAPPVSD